MAGERTEQASPQRKRKARERGDRPRSADLLSACATLAGTLTLGMLAMRWSSGWGQALQHALALGASARWRSSEGIVAVLELRDLAVMAMWPVALVFLSAAGGALVSGLAQGGGLTFYAPALQPKLERLNPLQNAKRLFSGRAASRLGKTLVPVAALSAIVGIKLVRQAELPVFSLERTPQVMKDAYDLMVDTAWILFAWSAVDFALEWQSWERRLRMTKQELREEIKESQGNPQIRARIRNLQRLRRAQRLRGDVAKASVVVTNPTHYAVALEFDFTTMDAPKVVAKGRNLLAERIKEEARWAGVPIVENPPLARSLYRSVETGQSIPVALYSAVAGILAYLYRARVEEEARRQARAAKPAGAAKTPAGGAFPARDRKQNPFETRPM